MIVLSYTLGPRLTTVFPKERRNSASHRRFARPGRPAYAGPLPPGSVRRRFFAGKVQVIAKETDRTVLLSIIFPDAPHGILLQIPCQAARPRRFQARCVLIFIADVNPQPSLNESKSWPRISSARGFGGHPSRLPEPGERDGRPAHDAASPMRLPSAPGGLLRTRKAVWKRSASRRLFPAPCLLACSRHLLLESRHRTANYHGAKPNCLHRLILLVSGYGECDRF